MKNSSFGNREHIGVDIADKTRLRIQADLLGVHCTAHDAIYINILTLQMRVGLTRLADRQRAGARQFALEHAVYPDAILHFHRTFKEGATANDRIECLTSTGDHPVVFFT